ncbi:hypothetical protein [Ktedonospora formicarum]|uniref:Uncharacterized protein n=1 Tax=Ktedonospora formicarum TaxID=2778364 RepID=A0A8J3I7Y0_9CHLR|nr:hypothetical protein [Ktedonospora formicarum]GHO51179.1 hypothetical protein KSX_93420 [Ktedonospora formicarum]
MCGCILPGAEVLGGNAAGGAMLALQACRGAGVTNCGGGPCCAWKESAQACVSDEK